MEAPGQPAATEKNLKIFALYIGGSFPICDRGNMSKKIKLWAVRARERLFQRLGKICVHCGRQDDLEFDCVIPCGHDHHKGSTDQRMNFYHRQERAGNLQVLCGKCNAIKGARELPEIWGLPFIVNVSTFERAGEMRPVVHTNLSADPF